MLGTDLRIHGLPAVSKGDCYCHSTNPLIIFNRGVNPQPPTVGSLAHSGPSGDREAKRENKPDSPGVFTPFFLPFFPPFLSVC